jgi:metal-responsive CopG/Arc/MetJ family transcriptional regulator
MWLFVGCQTKRETEKMKKQKVSVSLDEDLLATIDLKRGNVKRSTFLNGLIRRGIRESEKQ